MRQELDHHAALIYTIVLVAAAEGQMSDRELAVMSRIVSYLPAFGGFDAGRIDALGAECAELLDRDDGLDVALGRVAAALTPPWRETAYALACDVAAADGQLVEAELRMLGLIRERLGIERLVAAAIERAAGARHRTG